MKKIIIGLGLFLILGGIILAQEIPSWGEVYYKYAYVQLEKIRIGMESLISFGKEKLADVSNLESLKDDFSTKLEELEKACTEENEEKVKEIEEEIKEIIENFKEETKKVFGGYLLRKEAKEALEKAYEDNLSYLEDLLKKARELHKQRNLSLFDEAISAAEEVIQKLKDYGKDASLCEEKLSEIKEKRDDFENAMENIISNCASFYHLSCEGGTEEPSCDENVQNYCNLKSEIEKDFSELQDLIYQAAGISS